MADQLIQSLDGCLVGLLLAQICHLAVVVKTVLDPILG